MEQCEEISSPFTRLFFLSLETYSRVSPCLRVSAPSPEVTVSQTVMDEPSVTPSSPQTQTEAITGSMLTGEWESTFHLRHNNPVDTLSFASLFEWFYPSFISVIVS